MKFFLIFILLLPYVASSHSGRTDCFGGHIDFKTGIYHYHSFKFDIDYLDSLYEDSTYNWELYYSEYLIPLQYDFATFDFDKAFHPLYLKSYNHSFVNYIKEYPANFEKIARSSKDDNTNTDLEYKGTKNNYYTRSQYRYNQTWNPIELQKTKEYPRNTNTYVSSKKEVTNKDYSTSYNSSKSYSTSRSSSYSSSHKKGFFDTVFEYIGKFFAFICLILSSPFILLYIFFLVVLPICFLWDWGKNKLNEIKAYVLRNKVYEDFSKENKITPQQIVDYAKNKIKDDFDF